MSEELAAVLSALGALASTYISMRLARRSCDRRVDEVLTAYREGLEARP